MKIQYLVNWSFTSRCRMSSFTRALPLPSSSASLSCAVGLATYTARKRHPECTKTHHFQIKKSKKFLGRGHGPFPRPLLQSGGGHPVSTPHPSRRLDSARAYGARTPLEVQYAPEATLASKDTFCQDLKFKGLLLIVLALAIAYKSSCSLKVWQAELTFIHFCRYPKQLFQISEKTILDIPEQVRILDIQKVILDIKNNNFE